MEAQDLAEGAVARYSRGHDISRCKAQEHAHSAFLLESRAYQQQGEGGPHHPFGIADVLFQFHWITSSLFRMFTLLEYSMREPPAA